MGSGGSLKYIGAPEKWLSLKDAPGLGDIAASDDSPPSNPMKEKMKRRLEAGKGKVSGVDATETIKRQTGDWGVWKYYGKSIGAFPMLVALVFVLVSVFTSNFPSKSSSGPATRFNRRRTLAAMEYRDGDAPDSTLYWNIFLRIDSQRFIHGRNTIVTPLSAIRL
jgi:hypothetical protein